MGAATNTGEVRMDAAKRVLTEVINAIPDEEGINVGFRVYGHLGDNSEAGRAESCLSSELLVPMEGVDRESLIEQVNLLQPVGWTPLGYSLQEAAKDFDQPASEDVVNAIIVVTDGLETCDADPVAIAGEIHESEAGIITHVIGFGTTPEEQAILSGIAEAGGGELFGSDNAGQLMSALFKILEELEVVDETGTGESRTSPLGIGRIGRVGDYEVSVTSVTPNANDLIAAENQFNEPPAEGNQFFLAQVAVTYVGSETGTPWVDLNFQAVGESNSSYTTYNDPCGVIPNPGYDVSELFEGGSAEFNVCWQIDSDDADSLVMYVKPAFSFDAEPVWFSLGNPIEETVASEEGSAEPDATEAKPIVREVEEEEPSEAPARDGRASSEPESENSRDNPVPIGEEERVGDYEVMVLSVTPNADDIVAAENQFNEPPAPGNQFFLVQVAVTYLGTETGTPWVDLDFQAVGDSNASYTTYNDTCGVIPSPGYEVAELFEGGSAEFNVCWQIDSEDADSLVMYVEPSLALDEEPVWFSLEEE